MTMEDKKEKEIKQLKVDDVQENDDSEKIVPMLTNLVPHDASSIPEDLANKELSGDELDEVRAKHLFADVKKTFSEYETIMDQAIQSSKRVIIGSMVIDDDRATLGEDGAINVPIKAEEKIFDFPHSAIWKDMAIELFKSFLAYELYELNDEEDIGLS